MRMITPTQTTHHVFRSAILKLTATCNLNCSYCYMFNQADQTFLRIPRQMPLTTALCCIDRLTEHTSRDAQSGGFQIILHGGEPTLWPYSNFSSLLDRIDTVRRAGLSVRVSMQSNGLKISKRLVELLDNHGVSIGISVDGPRQYNDRSRVTHTGAGSYERVFQTIDSIVSWGYGDIISGFLCVAQPDIPPKEFLTWAFGLPIRRLDVLWPIHYNHDTPPWPIGSREEYERRPRYGEWFSELFRAWWERGDPTLFIRRFYEVIAVLLGSRFHTDSIVNDTIDMFVVNTDGVIEYPDYFRAHSDAGSRSVFNIHTQDLDLLVQDPVFDFCLNLGEHLPGECGQCPHVDVCGGGFLPGRMKRGERLPTRRSILCADHYYFLSTVRELVDPYIATARDTLHHSESTTSMPKDPLDVVVPTPSQL